MWVPYPEAPISLGESHTGCPFLASVSPLSHTGDSAILPGHEKIHIIMDIRILVVTQATTNTHIHLLSHSRPLIASLDSFPCMGVLLSGFIHSAIRFRSLLLRYVLGQSQATCCPSLPPIAGVNIMTESNLVNKEFVW